MAEAPLLQLEEITKNFGAIEALRGISFEIGRGEVVALLGDNGAGKSTLVKIISGGLEQTSGRILFEGEERKFASPAEAKAAGIETVYQDLSLCTNVDVVANFFMGREIVKRGSASRSCRKRRWKPPSPRRMANAGTRIPSLRTNVEHLSGGQRQAIELNRFVHWGGKLVLLDEPFAALGVEQTRRGLEMVKRIAGPGHRRRHHHPHHGAGVPGRRPHRGDPPGRGGGRRRADRDQSRRSRADDYRRGPSGPSPTSVAPEWGCAERCEAEEKQDETSVE